MAPQEASDFLGQRSTLFQIDEQRRASYTPAPHSKSQLNQAKYETRDTSVIHETKG